MAVKSFECVVLKLLSNCYTKDSGLDKERFLAEIVKSVCFLHRFIVVHGH
jgi:hypothetical protein